MHIYVERLNKILEEKKGEDINNYTYLYSSFIHDTYINYDNYIWRDSLLPFMKEQYNKRVNKDYHSALPTWSMFIRKSILDTYKYLRYPINLQPGEDGIFSHELLMYTNNVSFVYNTNYHYIKRPGQDSQRAVKEPKILLEDFYTKYNFWETKSLSFAKYIEGEAFLAFRTKNFTVDDERTIFNILKNTLNKAVKYINKEDYNKYFSKEFIVLIESNTIKEYYSKIKYKYNYIRASIFNKDISIRYKENRYKHYKNDNS